MVTMERSENNLKKSSNNTMLIVSLLLLNIVEQASNVITATIPGMVKTFNNVTLTNVEMLTTIVSIFITSFALLSGIIVRKIGQKPTAVLGISIAAISSLIPAFSNSYYVVLVSRAFLGIGIGLANPMAISLIGTFFQGDKRAKLMGWRTAVAGIGTSLMTYIAGQLLKINWHASYLVYLLFIPTIILFVLFVPNPEKSTNNQEKAFHQQTNSVPFKEKTKQNYMGALFWLILIMLVSRVCLMILSIKLPTFLVKSGIGTASQAATAWSFNLVGLLGGMFFGYLYNHLKKYLLPLGLFLVGIGIFLIAYTKEIVIIYALNLLIGVFASIITPYIYNYITAVSLTKNAPFYTSLALASSNLGAFMTPYIANIVRKTEKLAISNAGIILLVLAVCTLLSTFIKSKIRNTSVDKSSPS